MNNTWICPQCGGNSYHFSSSRCCLICDTCGTKVQSEAERSAELNFQKNIALARQHLRVGNWDEAKKLAKEYENSRPTEKQIYLILLAAVTKCYEDLLINDSEARSEALTYWKKLERLGCVNSAMISYSQRRAAKIKALETEMEVKRLSVIAFNLILTLITFGMIMSGKGIAILFIILTVVGWSQGNKWLRKNCADRLE